jgi:hypothetical protein
VAQVNDIRASADREAARATFHAPAEAYDRRRLDVPDGPFRLTARAWVVAGRVR